ncbi:hypothetical protein BGZ99_005034 [Dissophora globulifera]|uniref:Phosphatidylinositol 3,4,5-trisphosphate 3-phosphatase and dual-specificity protein phosphatase PTEN n=1 Tax=Dissophora globulifera TaxID=979702 RepID=A0A9P6RUG6_9FUNG|nr:hypothetical protein BGZ99_005034 [Dissophora globulifera]
MLTVAQFPFPDHSPPPFQLIHPFCEDVSDWLHTTAGNVVAVHCKAGKGRTGVMLCSFLVHCGATADEAIKLYAEKRTLDGCGVTIPSQIRYIHYYEKFLESRTLNYDPRLLSLHELVIDTIPRPLLNLDPASNYLILTIMAGDIKIYESMPQQCTVDLKLQQIRLSITDKIVLAGDVKMCHLCHFHFNTTFIDNTVDMLDLKKTEIDKACKDKLHSVFDPNFNIRVQFSPALAQQSPLPTLDSLPNRAILLKYNNHKGPDNVQISPPYYSSMKLAPSRNNSALSIFGIGMSGLGGFSGSAESSSLSPNMSGQDGCGQNSSPPNSPSSTPTQTTTTTASTSTTANSKPVRGGPVLVHSSSKIPSAFKPVWSDKDRDRDDNWDASSISSDCSESDSLSEWWYTKPPRPTIHAGAGAAAVTASASIVQPEMTVRTYPETRALIAEVQHSGDPSAMMLRHESTSPLSPSSSALLPHFRSATPSMASSGTVATIATMASGSGSGSTSSISSTAAPMAAMSQTSAYRSPPLSATSPLAREVKFDTDNGKLQAMACILNSPSAKSDDGDDDDDDDDDTPVSPGEGAPRHGLWSWEKDSLGGSYLDETGRVIVDDDDYSKNAGIDRLVHGEREPEPEYDQGWVNSVSRWFWAVDRQKERQ